MQNEEWIEMIRLIPAAQQNQLVVVLQNGTELSVDLIFRCEPNFMVIRGRVAGTTDEGRAFFVPYHQMLYLRIERKMKLEEIAAIFGEKLSATVSVLDAPDPRESTTSPVSTDIVVEQPADPAITARNALLERIRAARASTTAASRLGTGL